MILLHQTALHRCEAFGMRFTLKIIFDVVAAGAFRSKIPDKTPAAVGIIFLCISSYARKSIIACYQH
jgi:hypothetical protein